jgi:hypothetical protein
MVTLYVPFTNEHKSVSCIIIVGSIPWCTDWFMQYSVQNIYWTAFSKLSWVFVHSISSNIFLSFLYWATGNVGESVGGGHDGVGRRGEEGWREGNCEPLFFYGLLKDNICLTFLLKLTIHLNKMHHWFLQRFWICWINKKLDSVVDWTEGLQGNTNIAMYQATVPLVCADG